MYPTLNLEDCKKRFPLVKLFEKGCPGEIRKKLLKKSGLSGNFFNSFLKACVNWEVIKKEGKLYFLTSKCIYEPIRTYHRKVINETPLNHIYLHRYFTFYTPENISSKDFQKEDMIELNKIHQDFAISMRELLEKMSRRKAEQIWKKDIYHNLDINPMAKLSAWINFLINTICSHSSKLFLSIHQKMIPVKNDKIPREKALEIWIQQSREIAEEIFQYILYRTWGNNYDERIVKKINLQLEKELDANNNYCFNIINKINETLVHGEFTFVTSSYQGEDLGYKKIPEIDEMVDYIETIPWIRLRNKYEPIDKEDRCIDAMRFIHSRMKSNDLIIREEHKSADMDFTVEYEKTDIDQTQVNKTNDSYYYELGKFRFNTFNEYLKKKLLEFCKELGYRNKKKLYLEIGKFENNFPMPLVPENPKHIIEKNHFPKEAQIPN